jgi:GNAT superfamily N-acetyltransferase
MIVTDAPAAADVELLSQGLNDFNRETIGYHDGRPLAVFVTDAETGAVIGGISARTSLGMLVINLVYLPPSLRGGGAGRVMMAAAEQEAVARGCHSAMVQTLSFQAPGFYEKLGYRAFGRLPCDPPGSSRIKTLSPAA